MLVDPTSKMATVALLARSRIWKDLQECLFHEADFSGFGSFLADFAQNDDFLGSIFPFFTIFEVPNTVYSRREPDPVLTPIRTTVCGIRGGNT
jgi:hypothetical protein